MSESLLLQLLSPLAVAVCLGYLGAWVNSDPPPWAWWQRTLPLHPMLAGALLGLLPGMPPPPVDGAGLAGSVVYYAAAGALAVPIYGRIRRRIEGEPR